MAVEDLSIASAIFTGIGVAVLLVLYKEESNRILKKTLLLGILLMLLYGFNVEAYGWKNFQIVTDLSNVSYLILSAITYAFWGIFAVLLIYIIYDLFNLVRGRNDDEN